MGLIRLANGTVQLRHTHEIVRYGRAYVERGADWMGDEGECKVSNGYSECNVQPNPSSFDGTAWSVYEQVFLAALDLRDLDLAQASLLPLFLFG